jgi:hypothetical protein
MNQCIPVNLFEEVLGEVVRSGFILLAIMM